MFPWSNIDKHEVSNKSFIFRYKITLLRDNTRYDGQKIAHSQKNKKKQLRKDKQKTIIMIIFLYVCSCFRCIYVRS